MWGAGAGWLSRLLAGGRIRVTELHTERNPYFGGVNPEPIRPNIDEALGIVAAGGFDLGLLLDGDADRAGAIDERGVFIHQLQVYGLLMYYLVEHRGMHAPVVKSVNETSMAERLGERYGIPVHETPVGFKYVGPKMIETGAMYGGEESGGYGFGMHLPERDGIYADLLLLDLFLRERAAGRWPVSRAIAHLHEIAGPSFYQRVDVHVDRAVYPSVKERLLVELVEKAPTELAGQPVTRTVALDDRGRLQVLHRGWLVAPRPLQRHRAARPGLHGGDLRSGRRRVRRRRRGARPRLTRQLAPAGPSGPTIARPGGAPAGRPARALLGGGLYSSRNDRSPVDRTIRPGGGLLAHVTTEGSPRCTALSSARSRRQIGTPASRIASSSIASASRSVGTTTPTM